VPIRYEIDAEVGLILVELSGTVPAAEIFDYYATLAADAAVRPGLAVLADCRGVTSGPSFLDVYELATSKPQLPMHLRPTRAAVIVNQGWLFGIVRQFAALADRGGIRVMPFVEAGEARQWLLRPVESATFARPKNEQI
jgi:hypothetical protein